MPRYKVTAPDGSTHFVNAPEGASQEQALDYFRQNYKPQAAPEKDIFQKLAGNDEDGHAQGREDFMRAMWHHASGLPLGAAQLATNLVGQGEGMNKYMRDREAEYQSKIGDTAAGDTGAVLGELITAGVPAGKIAKGVEYAANGVKAIPKVGNLLGKTLEKTGTGAAIGALMPTTGSDEDYWDSKGTQAAVGGVLQPVASAIGAGASKVINGIDKISPKARELFEKTGIEVPWWKATEGGGRNLVEGAGRSLSLTRSSMESRERKMFEDYNKYRAGAAVPPRLPVTDEAGNVIRWEANPYNGKIGTDFVDDATGQFNKAYDGIYRNRTVPVDSQFKGDVGSMLDHIKNYEPDLYPQVSGRVNAIHNGIVGPTNLHQTAQPARQIDTLMNTWTEPVVNQSGGHAGVNANSVKEAIAAAHEKARQLTMDGNHQAANYMRQYAGHLEDLRMRGLPPEVQSELGGVNEAFRNFAQYRRGMQGNPQQRSDMLTPSQDLAAINANGRKYGGQFAGARGQLPNQQTAMLANDVMGNKMPDSGTSGRIWGVLESIHPKILAMDYAASKMMGSGATSRFLTGDTGWQKALQRAPSFVKTPMANVLRATPGIIGGQTGVE